MYQAELLRIQETTSAEEFPPFKAMGEVTLSLPTETSSYSAAPFPFLSRIWTPSDLPPYSNDSARLEEEREETAHELFDFSVRQLLQRERASLGIYEAFCETQSGPASGGLRSPSRQLHDERWRRLGETLEIFRSFEEGWDGYGAPAPNHASVAIAQILLRSLRLNTCAPRIMIDAEGDIVLTWDLDDGSIFLTVERSRLNLLIKAGGAVQSEEIQYEGPVPRSVLSKLPKSV